MPSLPCSVCSSPEMLITACGTHPLVVLAPLSWGEHPTASGGDETMTFSHLLKEWTISPWQKFVRLFPDKREQTTNNPMLTWDWHHCPGSPVHPNFSSKVPIQARCLHRHHQPPWTVAPLSLWAAVQLWGIVIKSIVPHVSKAKSSDDAAKI